MGTLSTAEGEDRPCPNNVKGMPIVDNKLVEPTKWATETEGEDGTALTGTHPESQVTVTIAAAEFDRSSKKSDSQRW